MIPSKQERERRTALIRRLVEARAGRPPPRVRRPQMTYQIMRPQEDEPYYQPGGYLYTPEEYVETPEITESPDLRDD